MEELENSWNWEKWLILENRKENKKVDKHMVRFLHQKEYQNVYISGSEISQ